MLTKFNLHNLEASIASYTEFIENSPELLLPKLTYPGANKIELPKFKQTEFHRLLDRRRSPLGKIRGEITLRQLSNLLYSAHGMTKDLMHRTVASPGATHPVELFVIARNVNSLDKGIYYHDVSDHSLVLTSKEIPSLDTILSITENWEQIAVLVIATIILPRTTLKYGERGYRFALMEVGAIMQNLHLAATLEQIVMCQVGSYFDDELCKKLEIDGIDHIIGGVCVIGQRES